MQRSKKTAGICAAFTTCISQSVKDTMTNLRRTQDYYPILLTDEAMLIGKVAFANGVSNLSSVPRPQYRNRFQEKLNKGASVVCFHVFGKTNDNRQPDYIFVWKVPSVHPSGHAGNVAKAID